MKKTKDDFAGKRVTVAGLGRFGGGIAVTRWLVAQGAQVLVTDRDPLEKLRESVGKLEGLPVEFALGQEREADFTSPDLLVVNPAIKPSHPLLLAAQHARVPITTEMNLFVERCRARHTVGVTGTKGKSTTTALLGRMLNAVTAPNRHPNVDPKQRDPAPALLTDRMKARKVHIGGNIGTSLLEKLDEIVEDDIVVLELSSYMLHYLGQIRWSPHVALVTMIGVDHVEWHGSPESYIEAKRNIVRFQAEKDFAVVSTLSPESRAFGKLTRGKVVEYGKRANLPAAFAPLLPGKHNRINERGAFAAAKLFGVYVDEAEQQVADFRGLPHRLETVHESGGVKWVNDSIATIPEAAVAANAAFEAGKTIQIIGGDDKGNDMGEMCRALGERCKAVLTIGKSGPMLASLVRDASPKAQVIECETIERAVQQARSLAAEGDVVLLSTACASYDQFRNFEERGERFSTLARKS